jgi:hypothetical protein
VGARDDDKAHLQRLIEEILAQARKSLGMGSLRVGGEVKEDDDDHGGDASAAIRKVADMVLDDAPRQASLGYFNLTPEIVAACLLTRRAVPRNISTVFPPKGQFPPAQRDATVHDRLRAAWGLHMTSGAGTALDPENDTWTPSPSRAMNSDSGRVIIAGDLLTIINTKSVQLAAAKNVVELSSKASSVVEDEVAAKEVAAVMLNYCSVFGHFHLKATTNVAILESDWHSVGYWLKCLSFRTNFRPDKEAQEFSRKNVFIKTLRGQAAINAAVTAYHSSAFLPSREVLLRGPQGTFDTPRYLDGFFDFLRQPWSSSSAAEPLDVEFARGAAHIDSALLRRALDRAYNNADFEGIRVLCASLPKMFDVSGKSKYKPAALDFLFEQHGRSAALNRIVDFRILTVSLTGKEYANACIDDIQEKAVANLKDEARTKVFNGPAPDPQGSACRLVEQMWELFLNRRFGYGRESLAHRVPLASAPRREKQGGVPAPLVRAGGDVLSRVAGR